MYRVTKALNHNAVLAIMDKSSREYLLEKGSDSAER